MKAVAGELAATRIEASVNLADFEKWMASEQRRVYLLCLRMLRNTDDANSATQDAFFKAYRALARAGDLGIEDRAKWITRIAVNTSLDLMRSRRWAFWRKRVPEEEERAVFQLVADDGVNAEGDLRAGEVVQRLSAALGRLSARQRAVFVLRHEEDRTLEEIGEILKLDVGTVKSHMSRALQKLREELRDLYGG